MALSKKKSRELSIKEKVFVGLCELVNVNSCNETKIYSRFFNVNSTCSSCILMFCSFSLIIGYLGKSMPTFKGVSPVVINMMLNGKIH